MEIKLYKDENLPGVKIFDGIDYINFIQKH